MSFLIFQKIKIIKQIKKVKKIKKIYIICEKKIEPKLVLLKSKTYGDSVCMYVVLYQESDHG